MRQGDVSSPAGSCCSGVFLAAESVAPELLARGAVALVLPLTIGANVAALAQNLRVAHLAVLGQQQQLDPAVRAAAAQSLLAHLAVAAAVLGQQQMGAAAVEVVLVVAAVAPGHSFRNGEVLRPDRPPLSTLVGSRS
jgi:hypothetical protein